MGRRCKLVGQMAQQLCVDLAQRNTVPRLAFKQKNQQPRQNVIFLIVTAILKRKLRECINIKSCGCCWWRTKSKFKASSSVH